MFRFFIGILIIVISNLIGILGYRKGKLEKHPRPYTVFVLYVAVSACVMCGIIIILNYFGLYPE